MNYGKTIVNRLKAHAAKENKSTDVTFTEKVGIFDFTLQVKEVDKFSLLLRSLAIRQENPPRVSSAQVKSKIESFLERFTYLNDTLKIVESDQTSLQFQVRSGVPLVENNTKSYFDLHVVAAENLEFRRRLFDRTSRRMENAVFPITFTQLERLVNDLVAVMNFA